jgi:hypothetical protein
LRLIRAAAIPTAPADLRVNANFLKRIKLICLVQPSLKKDSGFPKSQISSISAAVPPHRGALAIVIDAGRDAVDAGGAEDESVLPADGEVVWS